VAISIYPKHYLVWKSRLDLKKGDVGGQQQIDFITQIKYDLGTIPITEIAIK
jgi:uncharacterized protein (DUF3820 family)